KSGDQGTTHVKENHATACGPTLTPKFNKKRPHDQIAIDTDADHGNQQKADKGCGRVECLSPIQSQIGKVNQKISGQCKESSRRAPPNIRLIRANQRSTYQRGDQPDAEDNVQ